MPKHVVKNCSDLPIKAFTFHISASFDTKFAAVLTILHPQMLLLGERTFEKNRKMNNLRMHALFRVNGVSID